MPGPVSAPTPVIVPPTPAPTEVADTPAAPVEVPAAPPSSGSEASGRSLEPAPSRPAVESPLPPSFLPLEEWSDGDTRPESTRSSAQATAATSAGQKMDPVSLTVWALVVVAGTVFIALTVTVLTWPLRRSRVRLVRAR